MNHDLGIFNSNKIAQDQFKDLKEIQPNLQHKIHMYQANKAQNVNEKFSIFDQNNNLN